MAAASSAPTLKPKRKWNVRLFPIILFAACLCGLVLVTYLSMGARPHHQVEGPPVRAVNPVLPTVMRIGITIGVLAASLFIILAKRYGPKDKHWAYATVGTIVGYWLKG